MTVTDMNHWRGEVTADLRTIQKDMAELRGDVKGLVKTVASAAAAEAATQVAVTLARGVATEDSTAGRWRTTMLITTSLSALSALLALGVLLLHFFAT